MKSRGPGAPRRGSSGARASATSSSTGEPRAPELRDLAIDILDLEKIAESDVRELYRPRGTEISAATTIAGWFASASRRRRPDTCTSAARAPRSSTGCSRAGTAARSCCGSKTPTSSDRRPTWSTASSTGCAGSASTGTKGRSSADRSVRISSRSGSIATAPWRERLVDSGHAYYCYCTTEELKAKREAAERAGGAWRYDRTCCRSHGRRDRGERARRQAARRPVPRARGRHAVRRSRPRPDRVRRRAHRGLRPASLRRPADLSALRRVATMSRCESRT